MPLCFPLSARHFCSLMDQEGSETENNSVEAAASDEVANGLCQTASACLLPTKERPVSHLVSHSLCTLCQAFAPNPGGGGGNQTQQNKKLAFPVLVSPPTRPFSSSLPLSFSPLKGAALLHLAGCNRLNSFESNGITSPSQFTGLPHFGKKSSFLMSQLQQKLRGGY